MVVGLVLALSVWGHHVAAPADDGPVATDEPSTDSDDQAPTDAAVEPADRRAAAGAAFTMGVLAYKEERYQDALMHFGEAHELEPHPDTLFNLGLAQQAVQDHVAAWHSFEDLLVDATDQREREDVLAAQAVSRAHVAMLRVQVDPAAQVCLDGQAVPALRQPRGLVTTTGEHRLDVDRRQQALVLEGGETRTIELVVAPPVAPPPPRRRLRVLAGLGIAGGGAAAGLGLSAAFVDDAPTRLGLGVGAAVAGTMALTTSIIALTTYRRARRWTPPPRPQGCPIDR